LVDGLREAGYGILTRDDARAWLATHEDLDPTVAPLDVRRHTDLGRYVIWATFDPGNPRGDPTFLLTGGRTVSGRDLLDRVGVDSSGEKDAREVWVITFRVDATPLFTPTVADAGLFPLFRPSSGPSGRPGLTAPPSGAAGVPEVVQKPVQADRITRRLSRHVL